MSARVVHIADQGDPLCGIAPGDVRLPDDHGFVSIEAASAAVLRGKMADKALCLACVKTLVHAH